MDYLLAILGFSVCCFLFLQQRKQAELARHHIEKKCHELNLQVVSIAFAQHRFWAHQQWQWRTRYVFEFSALGDDCYQGTLDMSGFRAVNIHLPPYRMIQDDILTPNHHLNK